MPPLRSIAITLILLSPVGLLLSYSLKQQFQPESKQPGVRHSTVPTPGTVQSAPHLEPNQNSLRSAVPLNRSLSLPPADYLPPVRQPATHSGPVSTTPNRISAHRISADRTAISHLDQQAIGRQVERSIAAPPMLASSLPATALAESSLVSGISRLPPPERVQSAAAGMTGIAGMTGMTVSRVSVAPPNPAALTLIQPIDLANPGAAQTLAQNPGEGSNRSTSVLNNPTSLAFAEDANPLRQQLLIQPVDTAPYRRQRVVGAPASTISTPTGFGASWGRVYAGVSLVNRGRSNNNADGSASIGFGLGNPRRAVGIDIATNIISLSNSDGRDAFAGSGSVDLKVHRILPGEIALAIGWENALAWGDARNQDSSVYGVISRSFPLQPNNPRNSMPLLLSVGVGGGRFRSTEQILNREGGVGVFASAGLRLTPQFSLLANWTGQDLNAGMSFIPFPEIPFSLTLGAVDLTGSAGDGARFALSLGYGTRFNF